MSGISGRVRLNTFGLGDQAEQVCMVSESTNLGNTTVQRNYTTCQPHQQSNIGTLDTYYRNKLQGQRIRVLKIDVQGSEVGVLHHGTELFDSANAPVVVFFEYDAEMIQAQGYDPMCIMRYLWQRDYSVWRDTMREVVDEEVTKKFGTEPRWTGGMDFGAIKNAWRTRLEEVGYRFQGGYVVDPVTYADSNKIANSA